MTNQAVEICGSDFYYFIVICGHAGLLFKGAE